MDSFTKMTDDTKVTIYTTPICPYCHHAKYVLDSKGVSYREICVWNDPAKRSHMTELAGGRTTVPQIFINGRHVGGCDDLVALDRSGQLDPLLTSA